MREVVFILLSLLIANFTLLSQEVLDFDALTIEDGFASSKANSIIQDRKGFIWIGSWNGLTRFDGYECKVFKYDSRDSLSISNKEITSLLEDHTGDIWIGTSFGLNRYNSVTGNIRVYPFNNRIMSIFEDSKNQIWIGTWSDGLYLLDKETGKTKHYLSNSIVSDIFEDSRNEFWVATYYGLVNLDRESGRYKLFFPDEKYKNLTISHAVVTQIAETTDGSIWCGTWGGGLNRIVSHENNDSIKFIHYRANKYEGGMISDDIYCVYADQFGNLWLGTWNNGLMLLKPDQQKLNVKKPKFIEFKSDVTNPYSLSGNNITSILVDRSGILWVGSSKIDRCSVVNSGIKRFNTSSLSNNTNSQTTVKTFIDIGNNTIVVGTLNDLRLYEKKGDSYQFLKTLDNLSYYFNGKKYVSSSVLSLAVINDKLLVGTDDAGLLVYSIFDILTKQNPSFNYYNSETEIQLPGNKISSLLVSKKTPDVCWLGTMQNGFAKFMFNNEVNVISYNKEINTVSLSDNDIRDLLEDRSGLLWIATQKGLNCFNPDDESFKHYYFSGSEPNCINDNVINVLYEDKTGNLWIGTNSGLNRKNENNGQVDFKSYPHNDFLKSEIITSILEDEYGSLWVGSFLGIVQMNIKEEVIYKQIFTKEYQRVGNERKSSYILSDGSFLIGGSNGFSVFNPTMLSLNTHAPEVCFTEFAIYNKTVGKGTISAGKKVLNNTMPYTDSIVLSYKDDMFTVFFSAMDFKDPKMNRYKYLLKGYDNNWNDVGTRNSAIYTGVPPGSYELLVKGTNSDGLESKKPSRLFIKIIPPWWKSPIAYFLYMFIFGGLLYFFNKYSVIRVKEKSNLMLEKVQNEKDHELNELKSHFFTNITHEFRTPLTLILGPVEKMIAEVGLTDQMKKQLVVVQRNASRLLRLVNQLMEFRKVEKGKMELFIQKVNIIPLLVELHDSFKSIADAKRIDFSLNYSQSVIEIWVDLDKIEKVLFNLLSNAFKFTDEGGRISIDIEIIENEADEQMLSIEIEDTGIGIPDDKIDMIFERFYQVNQKRDQSTGGIGLYLSSAFIELHRGQISVRSRIGIGSVFNVQIPIDIRTHVDGTASVLIDNDVTFLNPDSVQTTYSNADVLDVSVNEERKIKPKLLLVEDDIDLNEFIAQGLSGSFDVIACFNGKEALKIASDVTPEIIVSDIMMPEMDGYELCRKIRKDINTSHIPLIFLTAKTLKQDEIDGLKLGAVDYIHKPFDLSTLNLKLNNILKTKQILQDKLKTQLILEPDEVELSSLDEDFLKLAVDAVTSNLDNTAFDVESLSKVIGMSSNQVYRKIKSLTGLTAKEFIRSQRLKTSANLLLQRKRSISEIIYMVGFSSPSYFTRCFKDYFGCTPSEYINRETK
ncbi:MAG: response regulator [Marinilabiliaceae bacterium]|nr:response regulator [Marinilabiliaceae bacterium]